VFKLVINLETANTLGVELPPSVLLQANELIEEGDSRTSRATGR
jgi:ABC-type uncharacterized transport system substrate-binding protein